MRRNFSGEHLFTHFKTACLVLALLWIGFPRSPWLRDADGQSSETTPGNADSGTSLSQVQTAIDTIYARYGVVFPDPKVQTWADQQPWYRQVPGRTPEIAEGMFTQADKDEVNQLADERRKLRGGNSQSAENEGSELNRAISIDSFLKADGKLDGNGIGQYLTDSYQKCLSEAPANQREQIRVPQRAWIVFSNKTETALNGLGKSQDDVWKLELQECLARANELKHFYRPPSKSMDELKSDLDHAEGVLTTVYQQSLSTLSESSRNDLIEAERAWVDFKDKNSKANAVVNPAGSGIEATILVVMDRVAELKSIYAAKSNPNVAQDSQQVPETFVPASATPQSTPVPAATPKPATPALATPEAATPALVTSEAATPVPEITPSLANVSPSKTPQSITFETTAEAQPTPTPADNNKEMDFENNGAVSFLIPWAISVVLSWLLIRGLIWLEYRRTLILEHPNSGIIRKAPIGFSWSTLIFPSWTAFFRADWTAFFFQFATDYIFVFGIIIWPFIYNKMYVNKLLERGFKVKDVRGMSLDAAKEKLAINLPQL
jgi:uncharacterized protein YecT (DUF1311 family)